MSFINYSSREINVKIVYYGPGLCGKTTNLQFIYRRTNPDQKTPLFEAIPARQSTRCEYDGQPISNDQLRLLEAAGAGPGVRVLLVTDRRAMESILEFVVEGNTAQLRDTRFVRELKHWLRFNGEQAARLGDGLYAASSGNPTTPDWLGEVLFDLVFSESAENDKYARHVRSSAGIAVFVSDRDDKGHWIETGRAFERFALQATALGIRTAHLNQDAEMHRTFNCGIGMVAIVPPTEADAALELLRAAGEQASIIGEVASGTGVQIG